VTTFDRVSGVARSLGLSLDRGALVGVTFPMPPARDAAIAAWLRKQATETPRVVELRRSMAPRLLPGRRDLTLKGLVYFLEADGASRIKIGWTRGAVEWRIATLRTGCPFELRQLGAMQGSEQDERRVHAEFAHLRIAREWFHDAPELRSFIEERCSKRSRGRR